MTANDENQTNSQREPDDRENSLAGSGPGKKKEDVGLSLDMPGEWVDDLGEEEFDDLEDDPGSGIADLPPPRPWDESLESSGTGLSPRKISSTFDDLPTFEQKPGSADARQILGDQETDLSVIKPGFDPQEQSIHLDAAQLARLAYAIEEAPSVAAGEEKVRHEGSMDAAQLAQLAFAIEDEPGRAAQADNADAAHLASLAKAIQDTRSGSGEVSPPPEPIEPTNHQLKYTFDDLKPIDREKVDTGSAASMLGFPPPSKDGDDDGQATLRIQRDSGDGEATMRLQREGQDVEETLRTSPRASDPLPNDALTAAPAGGRWTEPTDTPTLNQQADDGGETTLRLEKTMAKSPGNWSSRLLAMM